MRNNHEMRRAVLPSPVLERRQRLAMPPALTTTRETAAVAAPFTVGVCALTLAAFTLRALLIGQQSAFMDEGTYILTGRILIEKHVIYANALNWTYGSYLWSLMAGLMDMLGGLPLVRLLTSVFGALMVPATALVARGLAPADMAPGRRDRAALIAGAFMAGMPTAIGVGHFATYDPLAGAALMGCIAVLVITRRNGGRAALLAAAMLMFTAFLAKYVVAIFVPFICLYLMLSPLLHAPRQPKRLVRNLCWFVLPSCIAFGAYALIYRRELAALLAFSLGFTDMKMASPLRYYLQGDPELWVFAIVALLGWHRASRPGRVIALGGAGIILAFQAATRPDADWWKHSIYFVFFLAPLAGFALAPLLERLFTRETFAWRGKGQIIALLLVAGGVIPLASLAIMLGAGSLTRHPEFAQLKRLAITLLLLVLVPAGLVLAPLWELLREERGKPRRQMNGRRAAVIVTAAVILPVALAASLAHSDKLTRGYPNLNPALAGIRAETAEAHKILADDTAIRYYLYPETGDVPITNRVIDPFGTSYRGLQGMDAYRRMVTDRFVDAVVLDGGVGPIGQQLRKQLGDLLPRYYERVYANQGPDGTLVEVYRARTAVPTSSGPVPRGATVYDFDNGVQGWGGHAENAELEPGLQVDVSQEQRWNDHASLQFTVSPQVSGVAVRQTGPVKKVSAQVYVVPVSDATAEVNLGMMGFDAQWQWHDDGFGQRVPVGRWVEVSWDLREPGIYNEIGLKFPLTEGIKTVYLGQVEIDP